MRTSIASACVLAVAAAAVAVFAPGCGEELKPQTVVDGLRVLGIRSEPAELAPGETAALSALIVDPSAPTRRNTALWLSCDPDPLDLGRSACSDLGRLEDPTALVGSADGGASLPPGMRFAGLGDRAFYTAPQDLFSALPADDRRRLTGTMAQLLLLAIAEEVSPTATPAELDALMARVRSREVPSVVAIFRVRVSEQQPKNQNPERFSVRLDGEVVPRFGHAWFHPRKDAQVSVTAPPEEEESFVQLLPDGEEARTERLLASPYSTGGRFFLERLAVNAEVTSAFTPPGEGSPDPLPEPGRGRLWLVVRDTRGGQSWREHRLHLCEPQADAPAVSELTLSEDPAPAPGGATASLSGERLEEILDVLVGEVALRGAAYSPTLDRFEGELPPLPPGLYAVRLRTRSCEVVSLPQTVQVQ